MFTIEEFMKISSEVSTSSKKDYEEYMSIFNSYYSIEALSKVKSKDLAIRLFASKDYAEDKGLYPSLSNWAENGLRKGLSSFGKGKPKSFRGIRYDGDKYTYYEYYFDGKYNKSPNIIELKEADAVAKACALYEVLKECCDLTSKYSFDTLEDYKKYDKELKEFLKHQMKNFFWNEKGDPDGILLKYIATSFPDKFSFTFSLSAANRILIKFLDDSEKIPESKIEKNGLIRLKAKKLGLPSWAFENTCVKMNFYEDDKSMLSLIIDCLKEKGEATNEEIYKYVKNSRLNTSVFTNPKWKEYVRSELSKHSEKVEAEEQIFGTKDDKHYLLPLFLEKEESVETEDTKISSEIVYEEEDAEEEPKKDEEIGYNALYYGISGCGKSHKVAEIIGDKEKFSEKCFRTVFFNDYSYNDFVGHIEPYKTDSDVGYRIKAGPFLLALTEALKNPSRRIALVIEEINRGDAAGILGDIFQLLDRDKNIKITSPLMSDYLKQELKEDYNEIYLPNNLYIFATMNTSDQNVNKLDTAFKRRWEMFRITNPMAKKDLIDKHKNFNIPGFEGELTWADFVDCVNKKIIEANLEEDRQLGYWFYINKGTTSKYDFANKVLEYLWNDVLKYSNKSIIFNKKYKTFDDVIKDFTSDDSSISKNVFSENLFDKK